MGQYGGPQPESSWHMQSLIIQKFTKWSSLGMDLSNILRQWPFHTQRWDSITFKHGIMSKI